MDAFNTPIFIIIASPSLATYFQLTMTLVFNSKNNPIQDQVKTTTATTYKYSAQSSKSGMAFQVGFGFGPGLGLKLTKNFGA